MPPQSRLRASASCLQAPSFSLQRHMFEVSKNGAAPIVFHFKFFAVSECQRNDLLHDLMSLPLTCFCIFRVERKPKEKPPTQLYEKCYLQPFSLYARVERWLKEEHPTQLIEIGVPSRFVDFFCIRLITNTNKLPEDCPSCPLNPKGLDSGWIRGGLPLPREGCALNPPLCAHP